MSNISQKLGEKVRKVRLKKKVSQGNVARKMGVHRSYISGIERGIRNPSVKVLEKVANALDCDIKDLLP